MFTAGHGPAAPRGGGAVPRAADDGPREAEEAVAEAQAAAARALAEAELAEAKAAVARAKAELAAAQVRAAAGGGEAALAASEPGAGDVAAREAASTVAARTLPAVTPQPAAVLDAASYYSGDENRPARLLFSPEGSAFFGLLARLEDAVIFGNRTALDAVLQASLAGLWQFAQAGRAARDGDLKDLPADMRSDVEEVGMAVTPEALASALAPRVAEDGPRQGGDWRPLARALGRVRRLPEILERAVAWEQIFPDPLERVTGMSREEAKVAVLAFFRSAALEQCGAWSDAELDAAERLARRDERLRRVFSRVETVRTEVAETFTGAFGWLPLLLLAVLLGAFWCVCSAIPGGDGDGSLPADPSDLQGLPLMKLEK